MRESINSGELDRKLTIQHQIGAKDEFGHTDMTWTNLHVDIPCGFKTIKGGEVWESTQDVGNLTTDFKIRFITGITPSMRIVFEGANYDIKRVVEIPRRRGYVIQAQWKDNK